MYHVCINKRRESVAENGTVNLGGDTGTKVVRNEHDFFLPCIHCKNDVCRGIFLKDYIEERAVEIADYIIENNATVRQTAKQFRISKSTVHKDVTERLLQINPSLAREARKVLDMNKSERHIRGGMATREKYLHQHG